MENPESNLLKKKLQQMHESYDNQHDELSKAGIMYDINKMLNAIGILSDIHADLKELFEDLSDLHMDWLHHNKS